jgi:hypothetical protein
MNPNGVEKSPGVEQQFTHTWGCVSMPSFRALARNLPGSSPNLHTPIPPDPRVHPLTRTPRTCNSLFFNDPFPNRQIHTHNSDRALFTILRCKYTKFLTKSQYLSGHNYPHFVLHRLPPSPKDGRCLAKRVSAGARRNNKPKALKGRHLCGLGFASSSSQASSLASAHSPM